MDKPKNSEGKISNEEKEFKKLLWMEEKYIEECERMLDLIKKQRHKLCLINNTK